MENTSSIIPSLYVQNKGENSLKVALRLTKAKSRYVVRFTGGCGYMSHDDAEGLYDLFLQAFAGFEGGILFGGTRMIKKDNYSEIVPGITEIPPLIRRQCPDSVILGVIPKTQDLQITESGLIVSEEEGKNFVTIVHPEQDICLVVQNSVDNTVPWEAEYQSCLQIIEQLRLFAEWESLLVSYNGGGVTEKEILATATRGWPILLINSSGRVSERLANDKEFLNQYPHVHVAEKDSRSIRNALFSLGAPVGNKRSVLTLVQRRENVG